MVTPSAASTKMTAPSHKRNAAVTSSEKLTCPVMRSEKYIYNTKIQMNKLLYTYMQLFATERMFQGDIYTIQTREHNGKPN